MSNGQLPTSPFYTKEERIALIESVKDILIATIQKTGITFLSEKETAELVAEMYYTIYNGIIRNATHE